MKCRFENNFEIIDDYISGRLSEEKMVQFETHFFECEHCYHQVQLRKPLVSLIKREGKTLFADVLADDRVKTSRRFVFFPQTRIRYKKSLTWISAFAGLLLCFIGYTVWNSMGQKTTYWADVDTTNPYDYITSDLRATAANSSLDTDTNTLHQQFSLALSAYMVFDYNKAHRIYNEMTPAVERIIDTTQSLDMMTFIRDVYFYSGVNEFARSQSQNIGLNEQQQRGALDAAEQALLTADSLKRTYQLSDDFREVYMLAHVALAEGDLSGAETLLESIEPQDRLHEQSRELLSKIK